MQKIIHNNSILADQIINQKIDRIITDPPYFLSDNNIIDTEKLLNDGRYTRKNKKGFMGKNWDGGSVDVIKLKDIYYDTYQGELYLDINNNGFKEIKQNDEITEMIKIIKTKFENNMKLIRVNEFFIEPNNLKEIKKGIKNNKFIKFKYPKKINLYEEFCYLWGKTAYKLLNDDGYMFAFSGTRTYHNLALGLERAGFEIVKVLNYEYGNGFPKSYNISKGFDKLAWKNWIKKRPKVKEKLDSMSKNKKEKYKNILKSRNGMKREKVGERKHPTLKNKPNSKSKAYHIESLDNDKNKESWDITKPATKLAKKWEGYGTALKPAHEPIAVLRKNKKDKELERRIEEKPFQYTSKASKKERTCNGQLENSHPTLKPLSIGEYLIEVSQTKKNLVYADLFSGAGTFLVDFYLNDLDFIGVEKDKNYIEDIIKPRLELYKEGKVEY